MREEFPNGWVDCEIGDVAKVMGGGTPNASNEDNFSTESGIPWLTPADLSDYKGIYISRGKRFLTKRGYAESSAKLMPKGTVLFSSRAPIGYVAIAANEISTNQGFKSLVCVPGIKPEYLYFWMKYAKPMAEELAQGTTFAEISGSNTARIPFRMPPRPEQERIAVLLEELIGKVENCQQRLATIPRTLKRFRQSVLAAACSGRLTADWRDENQSDFRIDSILASIERRQSLSAKTVVQKERLREVFSTQEDGNSEELPNNWQFIRLNKLVISFDYGTSAKSKKSGKVPVLRMGNLQGGSIDWSDLAYTSDATEIRHYSLSPLTVLFNRTNSPELVGKTAIYRGERAAIFAGYLIRINPHAELNPEYLNICLNSPYAREFCASVKTDGVSQSNINAQKLGTFELPFCHPTEQQEIVRRVKNLFALADKIEARYKIVKQKVDRLPQSVLAKAFRGELVPTEAELAEREGRSFESAEQLLQRIRAAKEEDESGNKSKTARKRRAV